MKHDYNIFSCCADFIMWISWVWCGQIMIKADKQAGTELCQAQEKLGLAKPDLSMGVLIYFNL